jgi:hypothetical protein
MKLSRFAVTVAALLTLPGCERQPGANRTDGVSDAFDTRPNEKVRDAGEEMVDGVKDAGRDVKEAVKDN